MLSFTGGLKVFVALEACDMRKSFNGLEALVSEREPPLPLQRMIGIYNLVWAATGAFAYFFGGAMIERFGLKILFSVPFTVHVVELALTRWLES